MKRAILSAILALGAVFIFSAGVFLGSAGSQKVIVIEGRVADIRFTRRMGIVPGVAVVRENEMLVPTSGEEHQEASAFSVDAADLPAHVDAASLPPPAAEVHHQAEPAAALAPSFVGQSLPLPAAEVPHQAEPAAAPAPSFVGQSLPLPAAEVPLQAEPASVPAPSFVGLPMKATNVAEAAMVRKPVEGGEHPQAMETSDDDVAREAEPQWISSAPQTPAPLRVVEPAQDHVRVFEESSKDGNQYILLTTGPESCKGNALHNAFAKSVEDCQAACDKITTCRFASIWEPHNKKPYWCRLTAECEQPIFRKGMTIGVHQKVTKSSGAVLDVHCRDSDDFVIRDMRREHWLDVSGCSALAKWCDADEYGSTVQSACPKTCKACT